MTESATTLVPVLPPVQVPPPVPVLLYHSIQRIGQSINNRWQVGAEDFAEDMQSVVASGRKPMTATEYGQWLRGTRTDPDPLLVTFDDGFADFAEVALPILEALKLPATLFVTTSWIGRPGMITAGELREIAATRIELGAHSVTHAHLDLLPPAREYEEMAASRAGLEALTGRPATAFAYPHGSHRRRSRAAAARCGYQTAHAVKNALSHRADDPMAVARFTVTAGTPRSRVRQVIAGAGAPLAWPGERPRTSAYRLVRLIRTRISG